MHLAKRRIDTKRFIVYHEISAFRRRRMRDAGERLQIPMQELDRDIHVYLSTWLPEDRNGGRVQGHQRMRDQLWSLSAWSLRQSRRQLPMLLLRRFRAKLGRKIVYWYKESDYVTNKNHGR
jgi:hypothetical protein